MYLLFLFALGLGHVSQLPQVFSQFGIRSASAQRGWHGTATEMRWTAADRRSSVLLLKLSGSYCIGHWLTPVAR